MPDVNTVFEADCRMYKSFGMYESFGLLSWILGCRMPWIFSLEQLRDVA